MNTYLNVTEYSKELLNLEANMQSVQITLLVQGQIWK